MTAITQNEISELNIDELDAVSGGSLFTALLTLGGMDSAAQLVEKTNLQNNGPMILTP